MNIPPSRTGAFRISLPWYRLANMSWPEVAALCRSVKYLKAVGNRHHQSEWMPKLRTTSTEDVNNQNLLVKVASFQSRFAKQTEVIQPHHRILRLATLGLNISNISTSIGLTKMHGNLKNTFFVSAAAAGSGLIRLAEAQEVVEGGIAAIYGRVDDGPRGEPNPDFDSLLRSPNATGSFLVPGPSISSNATDTDTSEGWSWSSKSHRRGNQSFFMSCLPN